MYQLFRNDRPSRRLPLMLLLPLGLMWLGLGCSEQAEPPQPPPQVELGSTFCLTTQWYPQEAEHEDETENRLLRELVRQGILMAAREELGLVTRDETLGEPFPKFEEKTDSNSPAQEVKPLSVLLHVDQAGTWDARLFGAGSVEQNPAWLHQGKFQFDKRTIYAQFALQMTQATKQIADQLRTAGATGEAAELNADNIPTEEITSLLGEMNFVSQYAAIRTAHLAMHEKGPSLEWMGVLARGYANLSLLTDHTWSSHTEVFAARAILYAERMLLLSDSSLQSRWHRAYVRAIVGLHALALEDMEAIAHLSAQSQDSNPPAWTDLIVAFAQFDHDKLAEIAENHPELTEAVAFLQWNLYRSYQHGRWIYEKGLEAAESCPEAYGVYSIMANWSALRIKRVGSWSGAAAFGEHLSKRVASTTGLPEAARVIASEGQGLFSKWFGSSQQTALNEKPMRIARALSSFTEEENPTTVCSWSILANLIAEEQFVEAADMLNVSGDSVEHSKEGLVEQLSPLVAGHRYEPFIKSYAASPKESQRAARLLEDMAVVDPRGNMRSMYVKTWTKQLADGKYGSQYGWRSIWSRNFTFLGLQEAVYRVVQDWSSTIETSQNKMFAEEFYQVSPHSGVAIRLRREYAKELDAEDLTKWEEESGIDPVSWMSLGKRYYEQNDYENSARCYQRSLDLSPCMAATRGLAKTYYDDGKKELWESTLKAYLEKEDLGLAHAEVHQILANEHISSRDWKKAEPHALAAADTYSAWGLSLASRVYEGMQDWEKSEYYIAEAAQSYPSYSSGTAWYFWCCRTGQGDKETAQKFAKQSVEIASYNYHYDGVLRTYIYKLLQGGELGQALNDFENGLKRCPSSKGTWNKTYRLLHVIAANSSPEAKSRRSMAIIGLRELVDQVIKKTHPQWVPIFEGECQAFEGKVLTDDFYIKFDKVMAEAGAAYRCNHHYFLGIALDQQGHKEQAEKYLRQAAFAGPYDRYNSALAGHLLVQRFGTERGGLPEDLMKLEAEANNVEEEPEVGASDPSL